MPLQFRSPINLGIPQVPVGVSDELEPVIRGIYNALRQLQQAIGDFSGSAYSLDPEYFHAMAPSFKDSIQVHSMQLVRLEATLAITKGEFVNIFLSGGVAKLRKADASAIGTRAWGWALEDIANTAQGMVALQSGYNGSFAGMTVAGTYYLSAVTPGGISLAAPVGSGKIVQEVGLALSAVDLAVRISTPIILP